MIIGGLATMPSRAVTGPEAVASILPNVDRLYVFLDRFDDVPAHVVHPKITIFRSQEYGALGANGKLLGLLNAGSDDSYVCFDDDVLYPPNFTRHLERCRARMRRPMVVGVHGCRLHGEISSYHRDRDIFHAEKRAWRAMRMDVIATNGCYFRVADLNFDVRAWSSTNMVDLNFAIEAKHMDVEMWICPKPRRWVKLMDQDQPDSIYRALRSGDARQTELARRLAAM